MIGEVQAALDAYEGLDKLGKRLFRDEAGLVSAKGVRPAKRRKRAQKAAAGEPAATATPRKSKRVGGNGVTETIPATVAEPGA